MEVTPKSTKAEIIQGALEHIDYIESNSYTKRQTFSLASIALVVGWLAGVVG